jgi:hypothetical protein
MLTGSFIGNPTTTQTLLNLHQSLGIPCDGICVAPYLYVNTYTANTNANNVFSIGQNADLFLHDIVYDNSTNGFKAQYQGHVNYINAYNTAVGGSCILEGYEGGYQTGVSTNVTDPALMNFTRDIVYDPAYRIFEKDIYATWQVSGFKNVNTYSFSIYYVNDTAWGVYRWPYQLPGKGDGSDGLANNHLYRATQGLSGPLDYSKTSTQNQDALSVSTRGQGFVEWMLAAQTPAVQPQVPTAANPCGIFMGL